ncbi:hypothetical protein TNCV_4177821 [Trichonephila clavipes]|nr:hypothetical protein TNCV_4177821 [Trichonephila clavipes]
MNKGETVSSKILFSNGIASGSHLFMHLLIIFSKRLEFSYRYRNWASKEATGTRRLLMTNLLTLRLGQVTRMIWEQWHTPEGEGFLGSYYRLSPSLYSGYDPRLVTEWVRIPSIRLGCIFFGKDIGLSPEMNPRLERKKQRTSSWDHRL